MQLKSSIGVLAGCSKRGRHLWWAGQLRCASRPGSLDGRWAQRLVVWAGFLIQWCLCGRAGLLTDWVGKH
eukprot:12661467-Alexandrium_andersonii.AAC.1